LHFEPEFALHSLLAPGGPATATPEVIPPVIAENTIIAEGRVEPIRYAEIAFNISGDVGEVPVKEGQSVKKGDILIRLGTNQIPNMLPLSLNWPAPART